MAGCRRGFSCLISMVRGRPLRSDLRRGGSSLIESLELRNREEGHFPSMVTGYLAVLELMSGLFVFGLDDEGKATAVRPAAWRVKLDRKA